MKKAITIKLDSHFIKLIDKKADEVNRSRNNYIETVLQEKINNITDEKKLGLMA